MQLIGQVKQRRACIDLLMESTHDRPVYGWIQAGGGAIDAAREGRHGRFTPSGGDTMWLAECGKTGRGV